jgi:hypothetical protein
MTHENESWAALPVAIAAGVGVGAAVMYLFDPDRGRGRRARIRDQAMRTTHQAEDAIGKALQDTRNRASGLAAEAKSAFRRQEEPISNQQLEARVRSRLGHVVSHPHAVHVLAQDGRVMLSGSVLANEKRELLNEIRHIAGVKAVDDSLDQHESAEQFDAPHRHVSTRRDESSDSSSLHWTRSTRLLAILAGGGLALYGFRSKDPTARAATLTGLSLLARGMFNQGLLGITETLGENFKGITQDVS